MSGNDTGNADTLTEEKEKKLPRISSEQINAETLNEVNGSRESDHYRVLVATARQVNNWRRAIGQQKTCSVMTILKDRYRTMDTTTCFMNQPSRQIKSIV